MHGSVWVSMWVWVCMSMLACICVGTWSIWPASITCSANVSHDTTNKGALFVFFRSVVKIFAQYETVHLFFPCCLWCTVSFLDDILVILAIIYDWNTMVYFSVVLCITGYSTLSQHWWKVMVFFIFPRQCVSLCMCG